MISNEKNDIDESPCIWASSLARVPWWALLHCYFSLYDNSSLFDIQVQCGNVWR